MPSGPVPGWTEKTLAAGLYGTAAAGTAFRWVVHYGAEHTGVPAVLVAAVALVFSWRIFKRTMRFAVQVGIALTIVLVATHFGWLRF
jgi:hypothetical protein